MADLIQCPTCKNKVSINASACPHCGEPIRNMVKHPDSKFRWIFVIFGIAFCILGIALIAKGVQMASITGASSISSSYTTPAAVLLCVGVFCAVAPFCKKK